MQEILKDAAQHIRSACCEANDKRGKESKGVSPAPLLFLKGLITRFDNQSLHSLLICILSIAAVQPGGGLIERQALPNPALPLYRLHSTLTY